MSAETRRIENGGLRGLGPLPYKRMDAQPSRESVSLADFKRVLTQDVMKKKTHWSDKATRGLLPPANFRRRFIIELQTIVGPFPHLLQNVLNKIPDTEEFQEVRADIQGNILEEKEGAIAQKIIEDKDGHPVPKRSHAEMFLDLPRDLVFGFDVSNFYTEKLGPAAQAFRDYLEYVTSSDTHEWVDGSALMMIFVEGNSHDETVFYKENPGMEPWLGLPPDEHPLLVGYPKLNPESLYLSTLVHHTLDTAVGDHRLSAWNIVLKHVDESKRQGVIQVMKEGLRLWHALKDEMAEECGIVRDENTGELTIRDLLDGAR